jgi:putative glutamine amidotransferase
MVLSKSILLKSKPMTSPIIGITTYGRNEIGDYALPGAYLDAVRQAGGVPVLLPPCSDPARLLDMIDGLIFSGGGDIDPCHYGGDHHPTIYRIDPERDGFELELAKRAFSADVPVLGICRGMQILSVVSGAALIPHVPDVYGDQITHRLDEPRRPIGHSVLLRPGCRLAQIFAGASTPDAIDATSETLEIPIVSWHHQAVQAVPAEWQIVATAADELVEAIEHRHHPWMIGIQWHPELSPADSVQPSLFRAFVAASSAKRAAVKAPIYT